MQNTKLFNIAYVIIEQAQALKESCEEWRRIPQEEKTRTRFKEIFFEAGQDWKIELWDHTGEHCNDDISDRLANYERATEESLKNIVCLTDYTREEQT